MKRAGVGFLTVFYVFTTLTARPAAASPPTALDRYVAAADPNYHYELVATLPGDGFTASVLRMTSQAWLTEKEVDHPVWEHWLTVIRPAEVKSSTALLFISGGGRGRAAPGAPDKNLSAVAVATRSVVAELRGVPNQPLKFAGEAKGRDEDALIAYTWDKYLRTGDERWPARLPMTKSAVRAMDAVTSFCAGAADGRATIESFVVSGASKRGWTAWTTAAVDKRVAAVIPIVIDTLNVRKSGAHHYSAYGFFAASLQDYVDMNIPDWFATPQYDALLKIEEPYEYRDRLTMPKFILNASGDEYFPPDNSQFYFDDLPGVKYLRYVPNADHSLDGSDAALTLTACYASILYKSPLPQFSWSWPTGGTVRVVAKTAPLQAKLWQATNPAARDFRLETIGKAWKEAAIERRDGLYEATVVQPAKGWTAYFVELTFPGPLGDKGPPLKFTTQVKITPDVLPYRFPPETKP